MKRPSLGDVRIVVRMHPDPSGGQGGDAHFCVRLAVAAFLEVAAFLAITDYGHLVVATLLDEFSRDLGTRHVWRAHLCRFAVVGEKHFVKCNLRTCARNTGDFFNIQNAVLRDNILLAARLDDSYLGHIRGITISRIHRRRKCALTECLLRAKWSELWGSLWMHTHAGLHFVDVYLRGHTRADILRLSQLPAHYSIVGAAQRDRGPVRAPCH